MTFSYSIVELPERTIAGISVETTMQKASVDCPALWQKFVPLFLSLQNDHKADLGVESFGTSMMLDEDRFIYSAAVEVTDEVVVEGLTESVLPKSLYLQATIPDLTMLGGVYQDIYGRWANEQTEYALDCSGTSIEVYPVDFTENKPFILLVPIAKK